MTKVSLQINLAPVDYRHAVHILPHQLNILASQADEILLTLDTRKGRGRFAEGWEYHQEVFNNFLQQNIIPNFPVNISPVDYSLPIRKEISRCFFDSSLIPDRDFRGGPFYVYFFGLFKARNNFVFHLDSDMLLGGCSRHWVAEAVEKLTANNSYLMASPLPGPPHPKDILIGQPSASKVSPEEYLFTGMSTRIFLIDRSKFANANLKLQKPNFRSRLKALAEGNPPADLPEHIISAYMHQQNLNRVDFAGSNPGLWSLHPPYRSENFYRQLPDIIKKIETFQLPDEQLGFYDIIDEVCDWKEARQKLAAKRWYKKIFSR